MPDRVGLTHPKDVVAHPPHFTADGVPEQDEVANLRVRPGWIRPWIVAFDWVDQHRSSYGDVLEGGVAVTALLVTLVIGVTPWLAILLSVVTYIALALLRPTRERADERIDGAAAEQPHNQAMAEISGVQQVPIRKLDGSEAVVVGFGLTRREREILPLLAQRLTDREIAEQLSISHRTAMNHTANILHKLGLESRRDVAPFVASHEILPLASPADEPE